LPAAESAAESSEVRPGDMVPLTESGARFAAEGRKVCGLPQRGHSTLIVGTLSSVRRGGRKTSTHSYRAAVSRKDLGSTFVIIKHL